jgi:hypothetical protein
MRYFIVTGVSRLGVTIKTHEFVAEGAALVEDVFSKLREVNAVKGIRIRVLNSNNSNEILLAQRRGAFIGRRPQ